MSDLAVPLLASSSLRVNSCVPIHLPTHLKANDVMTPQKGRPNLRLLQTQPSFAFFAGYIAIILCGLSYPRIISTLFL